MKRAIALTLLALSVIAVAGVAGRADAAPQQKTDTTITGAGSTFVFPLISKWIPALGSAYGYNVTYSPIGSGGGIAQITARAVDFGASDAPLSADQFNACNGCVQIPVALSGTAAIYNVPGAPQGLKLTGQILADIYLGKVTNWNDSRIKSINPGVNLPDLKITPVFRSDGSGTTYNWTDYLSSASAEFKSKIGNGTSVNYPVGIGARGSSGVTGVVSRTEGGITYADVAYALSNHLKFARVKNKAGKFTLPGLRSIAASAATVTAKSIPSSGAISIVNPAKSVPLGYPICTFVWMIVPKKTAKAPELRKMIYWAITAGQKFGPALKFQPLPKPVQAWSYKTIKQIQS